MRCFRRLQGISLRTRILIFTMTFLVMPTLIVGLFTYHSSYDRIMRSLCELNSALVTQVGGQLDYMMKDVGDLSIFLLQNETIRNVLKTEHAQNDIGQIRALHTLLYLYNAKRTITYIGIDGYNGLALSTESLEQIQYRDANVPAQVSALQGGKLWTDGSYARIGKSPSPCIMMVRKLYDIGALSRALGEICVIVDVGTITSAWSNRNGHEAGVFYLVNRQGNVVVTDDNEKIGQPIEAELLTTESSKEGYYQARTREGDMLVSSYILGDTGFTVLLVTPMNLMTEAVTPILQMTLLVLGIVLTISTLLIVFLTYRIFQPLKQLRQMITAVENENFDIRGDFPCQDEISRVMRGFVAMAAKLKQLFEQIYLMKIKTKEAELKALQAQINPHFLYNTLDSAYWLAREEEAPRTGQFIQSLAGLFRFSLNNRESIHTVADELKHLEYYLDVQQVRFGDRITYLLNVDETLLDCQTVKLVLQPLVENAILHGIEEGKGNGAIHLRVYQRDALLCLEVEDDGPGLDIEAAKAMLAQPDESRSIGLRNVNDRIRFFFGSDYGLRFARSALGGTLVCAEMPQLRFFDHSTRGKS